MGRAGLFVAWLASCAPLVLPWILPGPVERFAGVSALALAALPWVFWLGAPRRSPALAGHAAPGHDAGALALALPPLAAAAGLDVAQGATAAHVAAVGCAGVGCAALLLVAARRAARTARCATAHAVGWLALVALPPLARFALEQGGGPLLGAAPAPVRVLAAASPLGWLAARAADVSAPAGWPLAPLALAAALAALVEVLGSPGSTRRLAP